MYRQRALLLAVEFQTAISVAGRIAGKSEDKVMYDQREKAIRDFECSPASARDEGMEKDGLEGREEGVIIGQIQLIEGLLAESPDETESLPGLSMQLESLRSQMRNREP